MFCVYIYFWLLDVIFAYLGNCQLKGVCIFLVLFYQGVLVMNVILCQKTAPSAWRINMFKSLAFEYVSPCLSNDLAWATVNLQLCHIVWYSCLLQGTRLTIILVGSLNQCWGISFRCNSSERYFQSINSRIKIWELHCKQLITNTRKLINFGWTATQSASLKTCRSQIYLPGFAGFLVVCEDFELVFHDFLPIWSLLGHAWAIFSLSPYPRNNIKQCFFCFWKFPFCFQKVSSVFHVFSLIWSFLDKKKLAIWPFFWKHWANMTSFLKN